jgi:hypothetical protein
MVHGEIGEIRAPGDEDSPKRAVSVNVIEWLLDSDPSIRWQVMRDLTDASAEAVASERSRVAREGWGARLLRLQDERGQWGGAEYSQHWTCTTYTLLLLRHFGLDPASQEARTAVARVRDNVVWTYWDDRPYFSGEVETCINGMVLALAAYFGELGSGDGRLLGRLLDEQLEDGGWNCQAPDNSRRSSFNTTITMLEGLWEYERAAGPDPAVTAARSRGEEYLLERHLFRRLSTGEVIDAVWTLFSFPPRWHYDVLRGLDYFRSTGAAPDERCREAIELVLGKRRPDGRWPLENPHKGEVHFDMDPGSGEPSRWNTLRALRVLRWYDRTLL